MNRKSLFLSTAAIGVSLSVYYLYWLRRQSSSKSTSGSSSSTSSILDDDEKSFDADPLRDVVRNILVRWHALSLDEPLRKTTLANQRALFGNTAVSKLRVAVVGLGGVGSHCALLLARAGVAELRLIDFDQVTLSSLNRHAVAQRDDVGISKGDALRRHIASACGNTCAVDVRVALFDAINAARLLEANENGEKIDAVVDCIDNVDTKADLIEYCVQNNIAIFVSTGSGKERKDFFFFTKKKNSLACF